MNEKIKRMTDFTRLFKEARSASRELANISDDQRNQVLLTLAGLIEENRDELLTANALDLQRMDKTNPLYDRLQLTPVRLEAIASSLRDIAALPSPLGEVLEERMLPNGIELKKVRVPFGVVGIVYEARPNVTFDVFALCLKSGNACVLKGGKDADDSNKAAISLIHQALRSNGISENACLLLPSTHDSTSALLNAVGYIDVCIPRGGRKLIDFVRETAKIPVIETGAGVVHTYFDKDGDLGIGCKVVDNGKTRRVSVCNALDTLLINRERLSDLHILVKSLGEKAVKIYGDREVLETLQGCYPSELLVAAEPEDRDREWMDMKIGIYTVDGIETAISHIARHGSGHSESIVTENVATAEKFCRNVDAACVYVNLPTSFTDGGEFGLGAEIGISTQKLGPRGPMGLREITTYRYILSGRGQTRP